jgi:hypothetical protein
VYEVIYAIVCGFLIQESNLYTINELARLKDEAVAANESKLNFIAKMRFLSADSPTAVAR